MAAFALSLNRPIILRPGVAATCIGSVILLRLICLGHIELLPEEAYYWNYSRHLDIGYLDHPPLTAWLIWLGTNLFGNTEFGVRSGAFLCALAASFYTYRLTRNLFEEAAATTALLLMQMLPVFFLTGFLMTPDAPLCAAWAASLYYAERALLADKPQAWWKLGICIGVGLLAKYTIGLLVVAIVAFMLIDSRSRRWFQHWLPYAAAALALVIFAPVLYWNESHGWASFAFQTSRRLGEPPRFSLHKLAGSIAVLLTPWGFLSLKFLIAKPAEPQARRKWLTLQLCVAVPLAVFALFSLRHETKLDWTGALWLAAVPALAYGLTADPGMRGWMRAGWTPTLAIALVAYGLGFCYLIFGLPGLPYSEHTELIPVGWRDLGFQVGQLRSSIAHAAGAEPLVVGMDRYETASELAFYAHDRTEVAPETSSAHLLGRTGLMYELWIPPERERGKTLLLIAWNRNDLSGAQVGSYFDHLGPVGEGDMTRNGVLVRHYFYRAGYAYSPRGALRRFPQIALRIGPHSGG